MGQVYPVTAGPLAHFVEFLWLAEDYAPPHRSERVLPTGRMGLVLDVTGSGAPGLVSGARASSWVLDTARPLSLMGVAFRPGGGYPFFALPAGELQELTVPLATFWGAGADALQEQLLDAGSTMARFRILERFLLRRLAGCAPPSPRVRFALREFQDVSRIISVGEVVARTGCSARRFIAEFRQQVGLAPKIFSRISRFRQVIGRVAAATEVDWSDVALSCGYYDQAHFIHEFREFAGVSPASYLRCRTASTNHLVMRQ